MPEERLPLLLFPKATAVEREPARQLLPSTHIPTVARQAERLTPRFRTLQAAFDGERIAVGADLPNEDPDRVLVLETVGAVGDFATAVTRIPGMEWLFASMEQNIEPDEDFFDNSNTERPLGGRLFLIGSNRQALVEVVRLWETYRADQQANLGEGLNRWKDVFKHLKDIRFWGPQDRVSDQMRAHLRESLIQERESSRFEVDAWCFASDAKNQQVSIEIRDRVGDLGGRVVSSHLLAEIAYHGFLVEIPKAGIVRLLDEAPPALLLSEKVMMLRPHGQAFSIQSEDTESFADANVNAPPVAGDPIVALLDGLPLANHPRLAGRVLVDDPDEWEATYPVQARIHGTAMASLIAWGELDAPGLPLPQPIYARPLMRPNIRDGRLPLRESTPEDQLLIDLVHRAVRRLFEREGDENPKAPSVKIINMSMGDALRPFGPDGLSPWARLLDWLSHKYKVLFVVSSGNAMNDLSLDIPRDTLGQVTPEERRASALRALFSISQLRPLLAPAESVNAVTVGAIHQDQSLPREIPGRYVLFSDTTVAPYSGIGPGFRRSVKPDVLVSGGRVQFAERPDSPREITRVRGTWETSITPGHKVACPPMPGGGNTTYTRGTSNAAAVATRELAHLHQVLEALRAANPAQLPTRFDAVMLKALLAHGCIWGEAQQELLAAHPEFENWLPERRFVARHLGYGLVNLERSMVCTEQRATLIGIGELRNNKALEFRTPLPPSLNATREKRRLVVTLAWLTPVNARHSKYRAARLWVDVPADSIQATRMNVEASQAKAGTLQHEVFEGDRAFPIVDGNELTLKVNCMADAGRLNEPIEFAICASLEVAEGVAIPIYQEIRERVAQRIAIRG